MTLLILISGVGCWFAFKKRNISRYVWERATRLLVTLIFAMLVIVPPQVYMERIFKGADYASFFSFTPRFLPPLLIPPEKGIYGKIKDNHTMKKILSTAIIDDERIAREGIILYSIS